MANRLAAVIVIVLAILLAPQLASACSVCMTGKTDEIRVAFIVTTAFLTFLPLGLIGGLVWWLRRRALAMQAIEAPHRVRLGPEVREPSVTPAPQGVSGIGMEGRRSRQPVMIA